MPPQAPPPEEAHVHRRPTPDVAKAIPYQRVNELVNGRRGLTPSTALRLSRYLGTTAQLWLNLQQRWDLYHAQRAEAAALGSRPARRTGRAA